MCQRVVSQLRNTLRNGGAAAKFPLNFACLSSNGHNFFVSTPNYVPFESFQLQIVYRLKHWTPNFPRFETRYSMHNLRSRSTSKCVQQGCGCNISVHGVRARLQTAITSSFQIQIAHRLKRWPPDFSRFETKYGMHEMNFRKIFRHGDFTTISQLRKECTGLRNGTRVPRGGFVAVKHPSKWRLGCEMEDLQGVEVSQPFRSCDMGLRNGTHVPRGLFAAAKIFAEEDGRLRNDFAVGGHFRSGPLLAAKFRRPCYLLAFELLLIPNFLISPLLTFLLILIIQKPMLHQNKLELKH
uniref:Uncharacterized protein n=1 Tax=Vitis vinifera TaxID=29760 RepID=A5BCI5_VITVI|nr:hypothetical protein VITISV_013433 [Vitis vinifera]